MGRTVDISLAEARALISRAIDKAEQIGMRGAISVVGASGALVSASRMDHGGSGGMARAYSKAWIAATQQIPSAEHLHRMQVVAPPMVAGFSACSPEAVFPGAGGMPIERDGAVVAGIAASGATVGPFVAYPGAQREMLIADGRPANGEDLIVHYALGRPYEGQHGDDLERWRSAYGDFPTDPPPGLGMAEPPRSRRQSEHAWARGLADRLIAAAEQSSQRVALAIVDQRGDPIQQDRMDGAPTAAVRVAQATAAAAATFGCPSEELATRYPGESVLTLLASALPFHVLPVAGAVPIEEDGAVVAALGVGGPVPAVCGQLAAAALRAG